MFSFFLPNSNCELIDPRKKSKHLNQYLQDEAASRGGLQRSVERGLRAGQAATAGTCRRWALGPGAAAAGACARAGAAASALAGRTAAPGGWPGV